VLGQLIERLARRFHAHPGELHHLQRLEAVVALARSLPFDVDLYQVQNLFYEMLQTTLPAARARAEQGNARAQAWVGCFTALGDRLKVRAPAGPQPSADGAVPSPEASVAQPG
jgi:hypothetical protein